MEKLGKDLKKLDLKKNDKNQINILLLGETGVGKSTFINAFVNYMSYDDMKTAKKNQLQTLIPTKFQITDKYDQEHTVHTGNVDNNEKLSTGESATQDVKTYAFSIWDGECNIRLIDTPGVGDTRGVEQDKENLESVLNYISQLHEIHAICLLFKSNESRITAFFTYCINEILSRLDKSASDNIVFCFTHTRGTDYSPGETIGSLRKIVSDIQKRPPHIQIPLNRNIFCFDNEPFRYLTAVKCGVKFDSAIKEKYKESWTKSSEQCWKLIRYITGDKNNKPLKPHFVKSTSAVNEARRVINQLARPLADISQNIHDNMIALKRHKNFVKMNEGSIEEMKKNLYVPVIVLEKKDLTSPTTVCTEKKCAEVYTVSGLNKWHYKQRCHDPCYLQNVPKELIGSPLLRSCAAMDSSGNCIKCSCTFMCHMHIYYITHTKEIKKMDDNVQKNISSIGDLVAVRNKTIKEMETKESELQAEHKEIVKTCAKFAHFLQNNAITPFNDAYKDYIIFLINREKSLGQSCDLQQLDYLNNLLKEYQEVKDRFDKILQENKAIGENSSVTAKDINSSVKYLFNLKHSGIKIKEFYECQKKARTTEHKQQEIKTTLTVVKSDTKEKKGKTRAQSPPPSYQDVQKGSKKTNQSRGNQRSNIPPLLPNYPPTNAYYQSQPGPSQFGFNNYNNGFPPHHLGPSNTIPSGNQSDKYNINITVSENPNSQKFSNPNFERTPNNPQYPPQNYNYPPNHPPYSPNPGPYYPPPPPQSGYPPYNFNPPNPNFQHNPNYPPPPSNYHHQGYDQHHGASGHQFRDQNRNPRGSGRGGSRGNWKRGDGAINKNRHEKKDRTTVYNKNKNKNKKEKKKGSSSNSNDSSDSSSS